MPRKMLLLLGLLAVLPVITFAWLGWRIARTEDARFEQHYQKLVTQRLAQEAKKLDAYFERVRRDLSDETQARVDWPESLRDLVRNHPLVRQVVVLDHEGRLVHPRLDQTISRSEREFVKEISALIEDKDLVRVGFGRGIAGQDVDPSLSRAVASEDDAAEKPTGNQSRVAATPRKTLPKKLAPPRNRTDGWYLWYWGRGLHLIYWHRWRDDRVTAVALSRPRWMSDILGLLPTNESVAAEDGEWRIGLYDTADQPVYQWGVLDEGSRTDPFVELPVEMPLAGWRMKYFVDPSAYSKYSRFPVVAGLVSVALGLLSVVVILYRDYNRDMREAQQRVNFVNQVSHELKTPLTNIRMYADLLEDDLDDLPPMQAQRPIGRLGVIVSESQRLTRLINNVLSFARSERKSLTIRPRLIDVDDTVRGVVQRFKPSLDANQIDIELELGVDRTLPIDPDVVEQIVGNLISNVERYAAEGKWLRVATSVEGNRVQIHVSDHGPGIPDALQQRVFEPFFRVANRLSDVNGTGIGLAITRKLAESHGGHVRYIGGDNGATFEVSLVATDAIDDVRTESRQPREERR